MAAARKAAAAAKLEARIDKSLDEISRDDRKAEQAKQAQGSAKAWGRGFQWQLWGGAGKVLGRGRGKGAKGAGRGDAAGGTVGVRKTIGKTKAKGLGKGKAAGKGKGKSWNSWQTAEAPPSRLGRGRGRGRGLGRGLSRGRGKGLGRGLVRRTIGGKARGRGKGKGRGLGYVNGGAVRRKGTGKGGMLALTNGTVEAYGKRVSDANERRSVFFSGADFGTPSSVLMQLFEQAGDVSKFSLYTLPDGRSRGMGYCEFTKPHMAEKAIYRLSGAYVEGRQLLVTAYEPAA